MIMDNVVVSESGSIQTAGKLVSVSLEFWWSLTVFSSRGVVHSAQLCSMSVLTGMPTNKQVYQVYSGLGIKSDGKR